MSEFIRISMKDLLVAIIPVQILVLLFIVQTPLCAWFVQLDGGRRLGLLRAAVASALQELMALGILVIGYGLLRLFALFVASLGR